MRVSLSHTILLLSLAHATANAHRPLSETAATSRSWRNGNGYQNHHGVPPKFRSSPLHNSPRHWHHHPLQVARGGGITSQSNDPTSSDSTMINVRNVVLALRYTGEINRQLQHGAATTSTTSPATAFLSQHHHEHRYDTLRGGARPDPSTVNNSYRILSSNPAEQASTAPTLTIFHTKSPRVSPHTTSSVSHQQQALMGASRWGPDLKLYLDHLVQVLLAENTSTTVDQQPSSSLLLTLALLYLDRSSSVETPRSNGSVSCPFVTPRTVHRLLLTSLVIAAQTLTQQTLLEIHTKLESTLGVPYDQLQEMVTWMRSSLGDLGVFVSSDKLHDYQNLLETRFGTPRTKTSLRKTATRGRQVRMHPPRGLRLSK